MITLRLSDAQKAAFVAAAARAGMTLTDWLIAAGCEKAEREEG